MTRTTALFQIASRVSAGPARGPARPRVHAAGKRLAPRIRRRAVRAMAADSTHMILGSADIYSSRRARWCGQISIVAHCCDVWFMCGVRKGRSGSEHDQDFLAGQNKRQKSILRVIFGLHSDFRSGTHFYAPPSL